MCWTILAALMTVLIVSWRKGFPRWSFPLWALMLILSLFMMNVATPGLWFFGYTFGPVTCGAGGRGFRWPWSPSSPWRGRTHCIRSVV